MKMIDLYHLILIFKKLFQLLYFYILHQIG